MNKYTCPVDDFELRRRFIGASDAPIIMNMSPWCTPRELWLKKLGMTPYDKPNFAMRRGSQMEEEARSHLNEVFNFKYDFHPCRMFSDEFPYMMASLDGKCYKTGEIVEIKCPGKKDHELAVQGEVPEKYIAQLQHQMIVAEVNEMIYFSYTPDQAVLLKVKKDSEFQRKLIEQEKMFFDNLNSFTCPDLSERDVELREDEEWKHKAERYRHNSAQLKILKKEQEKLLSELKNLANSKNCKGNGVQLTFYARKGSVQYDKIPELKNIDLDFYRSENSYVCKVTEDSSHVEKNINDNSDFSFSLF